jgi:lactate dehydrogenase-like 2-hydroxyacid dehydrogenase
MNVKKREFLLINTARGGIVSQNDLYKYFIINNKFNISLDVLEEEPPQDSDKLINLWKTKRSDRITINPHTAFYSKAAYKEMRVKASILALNFIKYNKLENIIV